MKYALHPRNHDFQWQSNRGALQLLSHAQADAFDRDGFIKYENAFNAAEVAALIAAIDPLEAAAEAKLREQPAQRVSISRAGEITFRPHVVLSNPSVADFCKHTVLKGLCHDLIGPNVRLYWDQSVYKKPGMPVEFPWHQDNGYTYIEPQQYLTCWIALTDATEANGCPWVVPKLHRLGTLRHEWTEYGFRCLQDPPEAIPIALKAGSIAVFSSLTPHRTGPNLTGETRKAYIVQYAAHGAHMLRPDQPPLPCDAPGRQFPILVDGVAV